MKKQFLVIMSCLMSLLGCASEKKYVTQNGVEFAKTIADPAIQLIDVRTPGEYAQGHLPAAVNFDVQASDFDSRTALLDKTRPVAVYCRSGVRSRRASRRLASQGYQVYDLSGGILHWAGPTTK